MMPAVEFMASFLASQSFHLFVNNFTTRIHKYLINLF